MGTFTICQHPDDVLQHSEGPWEVGIKDDGSFLIVAADLMAVAGRQSCAPYPERSKANALLIAAAPEMLAALKHAALNMPHPDQMIDEAISKAEGRS